MSDKKCRSLREDEKEANLEECSQEALKASKEEEYNSKHDKTLKHFNKKLLEKIDLTNYDYLIFFDTEFTSALKGKNNYLLNIGAILFDTKSNTYKIFNKKVNPVPEGHDPYKFLCENANFPKSMSTINRLLTKQCKYSLFNPTTTCPESICLKPICPVPTCSLEGTCKKKVEPSSNESVQKKQKQHGNLLVQKLHKLKL